MNSCAPHVLQHLKGTQCCEPTSQPTYCKIPTSVYLTPIYRWNILEPLKDPVTMWGSSHFAKDQEQCYTGHQLPALCWLFQLTCKLFLPKKTHFIPLPSFYLVYILLPYPLLNSFSSLLFHFFKSFHMLAASPFSQQQIQSSAIWQSKEIGLLVKFASRLARSS